MAKETNTYRKKRMRAEVRRTIVAELRMRDYSYREIQAEVKRRLDLKTYALRTVHDDVHAVLAEWRKERLDNTDEAIQLALTRNNTVRREAWEMWDKSKQDYTKERAKQTNIPVSQKNGDIGLETTKLEAYKEDITALGDPRYLEIIQKANQEEAKLLGLYAPTKLDHDGELTFTNLLMESSCIED